MVLGLKGHKDWYTDWFELIAELPSLDISALCGHPVHSLALNSTSSPPPPLSHLFPTRRQYETELAYDVGVLAGKLWTFRCYGGTSTVDSPHDVVRSTSILRRNTTVVITVWTLIRPRLSKRWLLGLMR